MEENIIEDEVQAIRKDGLGVEILGNWYMSKFKPIKDISKGDIVKVKFKNNKGFLNIQSIEKINKNIPEIKFKDTRVSKEQTSGMIVSYAKDIVIALIESKSEIYQDLDSVMDNITNALIKNYLKIKDSI